MLQVRLLNSVAGLRQLATEGLTREVYVFGLVQVCAPMHVRTQRRTMQNRSFPGLPAFGP